MIGDFYILDEERRPVAADPETWGRWFGPNRRRVADTQITDKVNVSTIFLGIDHRPNDRGPPILFETMIFGGPLDESQWRYCSWDDAETGHAMAVAKARHALERA